LTPPTWLKDGDLCPFNHARYGLILCGRLGSRETIEKESMLIERIPASAYFCLAILTTLASHAQDSLLKNKSAAIVYLYRHRAITSHPASAFVDLDQVCSVHPEMFCVVEIEPGEHGIGQFVGPVGGGQNHLKLEAGKEYFFSFKPNNVADWGCAMLAGSCPDAGWRPMPEGVGRREIQGLKREEVTVTPRLLARHGYFANELGQFESIAIHLADRVTITFLYSLESPNGGNPSIPDMSSALLVRVSNWDEWSTDSGFRIQVPSNVLPGHKALWAITGDYNYSDPLSKGVEAGAKAIIGFLRKQTRDLRLFFVVDPPSGRQIFFLNNSNLKDSEVWGRYPYYYTDVKGERKSCLARYFDATKAESSGEVKDWPYCLDSSDVGSRN
jgi:hypothetical protein